MWTPMRDKPQRFGVGDRVERLGDVHDRNSAMMRGTVIRVYDKHSKHFGYYPELYDVEWDGIGEKQGYLPHGLDSETSVQTQRD